MNEFFKQQTILPTDTFPDILVKMCSAKGRDVFINYAIFKLIASQTTYERILSHVFEIVKQTAKIYGSVIARLYMKTLTIADLDRHKPFLINAARRLNDELPDTLDACYIYKTPFVFAQIYNLFASIAIDKETREKVKLTSE